MARQVTDDERAVVQQALRQAGIPEEVLKEFEAYDLDCLFRGGYKSAIKLKFAKRQDLLECGLQHASVGLLLDVLAQGQGTSTSGAGPLHAVTADPDREAVLKDLQKLAHKYEGINLDDFLDGKEELLVLGLGDLSTMIPAGLRTDILFRDSYAGVLAINRAGNYKGAVVYTGTPGVGKTAAALVIACDLASKGRQFVHRSTDAGVGEILVYMDFREPGQPRVDYAHGRQISHFARLSEYFDDPTVLIIWDGNLPRGQYRGERAYIVLSSPNEDNFRDFSKGGVPVYYVDTWTLPEILKALPLYKDITREEAVERFRLFGGTVRDVLANAHVPRHTFSDLVETTIGAVDLDSLCKLSFQGTSSDLKHRFAHMRAGPDMRFAKLVIASSAIRQLVYKKYVDLNKRNVRDIVLSGAAGVSAYAGFRGHMLEEVGHEKLPETPKVTIKPAKQPTRAEAITAALAAASNAVTAAAAGVATQAAVAIEQGRRPSAATEAATEGIISLRRSKRRRTAESSSHAQQVEGEEQIAQIVQEMEEEMEGHHILPTLDLETSAEVATSAAEGVQQQLAGMQLDNREEEVQLKAVQKVWDYPGLDIRDMSEYYLQPTTTNNAAWDAVRKCPQHLWILQYTISEWHGIKAQPILDLLARFSPEDQIRAVLVYAVPSDVYPRYLQQPWLTVGKKVMVNVPKPLACMPQKVLKMPLGDVDSRDNSEGGSSSPSSKTAGFCPAV